MSEKEKELKQRYIYEVTSRVSKKQRKEIDMELNELIDDMYEAKAENKGMEQILKELGEPEEFAKQYRDENKYLISPEYFDDYSWFVKIVWGCILISNVVSFFLQLAINAKGIDKYFMDTIINLIIGCIFSFGIVTVIFAYMENKKVKIDIKRTWSTDKITKEWNPFSLPPVPNSKALISRGECIASIIAIVIFGIFFIMFPSFVGMAANGGNGREFIVISPFNLEYLHIILPLVFVSIGIELSNEIYKLLVGKYNKKVMIAAIASNIFQGIISIILLKVIPFFNPEFITEIEKQLDITVQNKLDLLSYWNTDFFSNIILLIIIGAMILETGTVIYKTLKYGE